MCPVEDYDDDYDDDGVYGESEVGVRAAMRVWVWFVIVIVIWAPEILSK